MPLLTLNDSLKIYKNSIRKNPKFGMDIHRTDFECEDVVVLEKDITFQKNNPIKFGFYVLFLCLDGEITRYVNQHKYHISKYSLQCIPPNTIYNFENITETSQVYILLFTEPFIKVYKPKHVTQALQEIFDFHNNNLQPALLSQSLFAKILHFYQDINNELHEKEEGYQHIIRLIIYKIMILLMREKRKIIHLEHSFQTRAQQLSHAYLGLIEKHFLKFKKVSDYATLLGITPKHLGETIKETLGNSALSFIHHRLLKEALYLLEYTDLTISQISNALSFANVSEFTRFFKTHNKITPKAFRLSR